MPSRFKQSHPSSSSSQTQRPRRPPTSASATSLSNDETLQNTYHASSPDTAAPSSPSERAAMIEKAAYFRYLSRGAGADSSDAREDWLQAEREIDALLAKTTKAGPQGTHH